MMRASRMVTVSFVLVTGLTLSGWGLQMRNAEAATPASDPVAAEFFPAELQRADSPEPAFHFESGPRTYGPGPAIEGYVYNGGRSRLTNVRLRIEMLGADGTVTAEGFGWVLGDLVPGGRGYFVVHVPAAAASHRISVVSFDVVSRDA